MPSALLERIRSRRRLFLVRHGDVDYFDESGKPLPPLTVSLNENGRGQIQALATEMRGVPLDRVVSSGLLRTVQSATLLAEPHGLSLEECGALEEIRPGKLEDLHAQASRDNASVEDVFTGAMSHDAGPDAQFLGGERFGDFRERVLTAFADLLGAEWKNLLLVAHGGTNRIILLEALGAPLSSIGHIEQDPGCLNIIDFSPSISGEAQRPPFVRLLNHTAAASVVERRLSTSMEEIYLDYQRRLHGSAEDR